APRIGDVEGALAPRSLHHVARGLAVDLEGRECLELLRPRVHRFELVDGEVERLCAGRGLEATRRWVEDGENDATAIEVVARAGVALTSSPKKFFVERGRFVDVRDLEGDAEDFGSFHDRLAF